MARSSLSAALPRSPDGHSFTLSGTQSTGTPTPATPVTHPKRSTFTGKPIPYLGLTYEEACDAREWLGVQTDWQDGRDACQLWKGTKNRAGYGVVRFRGKTYMAHRLAWLLCKSEIPEGLVVCHHCDTPACIASTRLWLGTREDNTADCVRKGRNFKGARKGSLLTDRLVIRLRRMVGVFKTTPPQVSRAYANRLGVAEGTVYQALVGQSRAHLPGARKTSSQLRMERWELDHEAEAALGEP